MLLILAGFMIGIGVIESATFRGQSATYRGKSTTCFCGKSATFHGLNQMIVYSLFKFKASKS